MLYFCSIYTLSLWTLEGGDQRFFDIFTIIIYQNHVNINVKVFFLAFNVYCNVGYQEKKLIFVFIFFSKISTWIFGIYYILKKINLFIYFFFLAFLNACILIFPVPITCITKMAKSDRSKFIIKEYAWLFSLWYLKSLK